MQVRKEAGYFIGVGSNLQPRSNIPRALEMLGRRFGRLHSSSVYMTEPVGVDGDEMFLNLVLFIPTRLPAAGLKAVTNDIETALGRDRSRPDRKRIARPVDLDTLRFFDGTASDDELKASDVATEPYFALALSDLLHYLGFTVSPAGGLEQRQPIAIYGRHAGGRAFSIVSARDGGLAIFESLQAGDLPDV